MASVDRWLMQRIPTLDGWRAIAISMVLWCHVSKSALAGYGGLGVDVFFGLSGLLITILLLEESKKTGSMHLGRFYIRRAFRILPAYFLFLLGYALISGWRSSWEAISCILFFRNYAPDAISGTGSLHLWSLAIEEHFYLIWPGLLAWMGVRHAGTWAPRLALAVGFWRMIESQFTTPLFPDVLRLHRTDLRLDALLWGCAVAFLLHGEKTREALRKQLSVPVWIGLFAALGLAILIFSPMATVAIAMLIPFLLVGTVLHPEWLFSRLLELPPLVWLGRISYSLYLWQAIFTYIPEGKAGAWWQQTPINLVFSVFVAAASYYFLEQPLIGMGRRIASGLVPASPRATFVNAPSEAQNLT